MCFAKESTDSEREREREREKMRRGSKNKERPLKKLGSVYTDA